MADVKICDGCASKQDVGEELVQRGIVHYREYCGVCADKFDVYSLARDEIHSGLVRSWHDQTTKLRGDFIKSNPHFDLAE